jgi:hypothetical protein|tara:strand:+ start:1845 stop:2432 length:588 start_codon:yes stop_codon:yes gene_type:complete
MYVLTDVPKDILDILDTCINEKGLKPINDELAGNLKHEYSIPKGKAAVSPFLMRLIIEHQKKYPDFFKQAHSTLNYKHCEIELFNLWVNFQKKYEFNPMHVHDGLYSFVIWHKIPYKIDEEKARLKMKEIDKRAGMFAFLFTGLDGKIHSEALPVDNSWEGKCALFPAKLNHLVYPFYTSDDYRISISGNLGFKT